MIGKINLTIANRDRDLRYCFDNLISKAIAEQQSKAGAKSGDSDNCDWDFRQF